MKTLLSFLFLAMCAAPPDSLLLVSWNVENFLDYRTDSTGRYTAGRFYNKCNAVSKTLLLIAERFGRLPDAVALTEVGDRFVLERLLGSTPLRKLDYAIVHYESPDRRGIDCALLYRRSVLKLRRSSPKHLIDSGGAVMRTRDILLAEFDSLDILVNHHPSKVGGDSERRRAIAQRRMRDVMDSLQASGHGRIVSVGDLKIDGYFARGLKVRESVFADPLLSERDRSFGGTKPRRAFVGPRYNGGVSDHYPIVLWLK